MPPIVPSLQPPGDIQDMEGARRWLNDVYDILTNLGLAGAGEVPLTPAQIADTYLALAGGTLTGNLNGVTPDELALLTGLSSNAQEQLDATLASADWGTPICRAYLASDLASANYTSLTTVPYDTADLNEGSDLDTGTGIFTAGVAGDYLVVSRVSMGTWTLAVGTGNTAQIRRNATTGPGNVVEAILSHGYLAAGRGNYLGMGLFTLAVTDTIRTYVQVQTDPSVVMLGGPSETYMHIYRVSP